MQQGRQQGGAAAPAAASCLAAWAQYFPGSEYDPQDRKAILVNDLIEFLCTPAGVALLAASAAAPLGQDRYVLHLDYEALAAASGNQDIDAALALQPAEGLSCICAAVYQVCGVGGSVAGVRGLFGCPAAQGCLGREVGAPEPLCCAAVVPSPWCP